MVIRVGQRKRYRNFAYYLCCLPIFLAKLLICCETFISQRIQSYQAIIGFSHKQILAVFTDERFCVLMKHRVLLAIQAKLKLANCCTFQSR